MARRPRQLSFTDRPTWGGKRSGAGRPRLAARPQVEHRARARFARTSPLHVTLRMADHVYSLRSQRGRRVVERALLGGAERFGVRVVQLSLQGNHLHLIVEAPDQLALSRAMKGLGVRLARRLNAMMGSSGRVLGDRYHARRLRTPAEARAAIHYVRDNHRHHGLSRTPVDDVSAALMRLLPAPRLWLLGARAQRMRR